MGCALQLPSLKYNDYINKLIQPLINQLFLVMASFLDGLNQSNLFLLQEIIKHGITFFNFTR